jgi:putative endonuclease
MNSTDLALAGEDAAARHLQERDMQVVARRFRCRAGEIDLILDDHGILVFAEVKTRRKGGRGQPWEAVNHRKMRKIATVARWFLAETGQQHRTCRFDVVDVLGSGPENFRIRHFSDAFRL